MESLVSYLNGKINKVLGRGLMDKVVVVSIIVTAKSNELIDNNGLILEAKTSYNPIPGVKHYSYRIDKQIGDGGPGRQRHIHIYYDGVELFALNADGTAHDGYHQVQIPEEIASFLKQKNFPIPPNNIIELRMKPTSKSMIVEELNIAALDPSAFNSKAFEDVSEITIIEANVETYEVRCNSKVLNKYQHVNKLEEIPKEHLYVIKQKLIDFLKETGKYCEFPSDILNDNLIAPHRLYVAWNNKS